MYPWLWFWAPQLHFPWSGSVDQRIEPNTNWFFDAIAPAAGNGKIEKQAFELASYGRQLGLIMEVLIDVAEHENSLSADAASSLERLKSLKAQIEKFKESGANALDYQIEDRLRTLRQTNKPEYDRLSTSLRRLLDEEESPSGLVGSR